ncbi:pericentrin isoform X14 [Bubalus kerabau]|uniref:pericentrin isoform X14 n=1 Tax=Bubalus carabanensis TaxID=3119969 RepID=UPI00244E76A7|nr:pericentrin isoform X14 [Bubalus carabanensis]
MEDDEQEQRRKKVEAGRAKLAHFRQRKTKGDCTNSKKTPAKRKGTTVNAPVAEESPVAAPGNGGPLGGLDIGKNPTCSDTPDGAEAAQLQEPSRERTPPKLDGHCAEQPGVMTKELELEVLRLSLSDMHAARLERTQAHLQREKEVALAELHAELTGRHAQERALLQSRARRELELVREEAAELKEKLQSEIEKNAQMIEILKQDWESERDSCLENLRQELLEKHRSELENLQNQFKKELAQQKAEFEKVFQAKNQAECSLQTQEAQHEAALSKLRTDLQLEHCQYLEELERKFQKKEKENQLELERLRASYEELQARSREEIQCLGAQLESARSSRQELSELREQLLARASHVEELELLKRDLEQQQQQERSRHESELEQLRLYFEEKLREAEQSYQEDLTLLQRRLQEGRDDSLLEAMGTSACLEETSEERDHLDGLSLQREQLEESLSLRTRLEENHQCQLAAGTSSQDADQEALEGELPAGPSEEPGQELAREPLLCAQSTALELETEVPAGDLGLETAHMAQLLLLPVELKEEIDLLKVENRNLQEKLRREICLKEDLEKVKQNLVEAHQEDLKSAEEKIEQMKQELREREAEWKVTSEDLRRGAEERLTKMLHDLREQVESEKRSMMNRFELRESEMRQLQDQQAAQILDLEGSLVEQQGRLRQLELGLTGDESLQCSHCGRELGCSPAPGAQDQELAILHLKEDCALQLKVAQSRFLEERRAITEKLAAEQDAFLREAQEQHAHELRLLQEGHQRHILSLTAELETRRQAEVDALRSLLEREQLALAEAREAESQVKHAADISVLEARHASHLDALRLQYLSELQAVQGRHRRALELLRLDLEERLQKEDVAHHGVLTQVLELLELRCAEEPQSAEDSQRGDGSVEPREGVRALWLPMARKQEPEAQCSAPQAGQEEELELLECKPEASLEQQVALLQCTFVQGEFGSERKAALHEKEEIHKLDHEKAHSLYEKEKESLSLQLQEKNNQILQLKDQILSLNREIEERHSELEKLQERRERENQEGTALIAMLKSDVDLSHGERRALQDTLRRLLGLFGETLQTAIALKNRIGERVGLCLEDRSPPTTHQSPPTDPALDDMWVGLDVASLEPDGTVAECAETSSVAEISSHVCESFFLSPERTLDCEQPVRRVFQSLGLAVDGLLEMVLDSARQLEEARQIHSRFEKEFSCKNEETAQVVRKHQELLEQLEAESKAKAQLALELHKAEGIIEGFKEEKAGLQEALGQKEASERGLVGELEGLRQQLQRAARRQAELREENAALCSQTEALAADAREKEAGIPVSVAHEDSALQREVESLTQEQSEARRQADKDRASLLSQMRFLEAELEEQLSHQQACARQAEELAALRQQIDSLDQHLRRQRQFMDEQAVEREREREDFQQEIQRLEEQLRQAARPRSPGLRDSHRAQLDKELELLEEKLREKSDGLNELILKKELVDRQVLIQGEEIRRLEETNASTMRKLLQLQEELETQRRAVRALQQDKEALQEQQMSNLLQVSALQSRLDEGKCPVPPEGGRPDHAEAQLEAVQGALRQREAEVLDIKEQLENLKDDLVNKNEEILHLNWKLGLQDNSTAARIKELQEENARLKTLLQNKESEMMHVRELVEAQLARTGSGALSEDKGKLLEDCRLQKVDLIAQVKQLQEKLNHLVCSMSFQNIEMEDFKYQQALASPCALEDGLSDGSDNSEETDKSSPIDTFNIIWDLAEVTGNSDSLIRNEPDAPTGEQVTLQDRSLCLQGYLHGCSQDLTHSQGSKPLKNVLRTMDLSPWSSPEVVREDSTLEPPPNLPLTPCSDALSLHSLDTSLWDGTSTHLLQADQSGRLCYPGKSAAGTAPKWVGSPLAADGAPSANHHAQRVPVEKDVEDFIITSLDSQEKSRSPPLGIEGKSDGKSGGVEFAEPLSQGSGRLGAPTASPAAPPVTPRDCRRPLDTMKEKEVHPKQVKALLQMVCDESHHILALSEYRGPPHILSRSEPSARLECLPAGGQGLLEAVPAPREHPTPGSQKGEKASSNVGLDWRGDFLQTVQEAFEKEREMLRVELWPQLCGLGPGGCGSLLERLEKVVHEQGDQQERSLEHLCLSDRSSLLSEIQALRAQLRMTHLQNQEKLQQLCTALTSAEARGSRQEHRLRRQVELLAYKVEQEKCIASDLQKTLNEEQEKANNVRKLLVVEQNAVRDLKSELCECRQDNERLLKSLNDVQKEVLQLRSVLDSKESDLQAALQQLEGERVKEQTLQSQLEEERLQHMQREGQSAKTLEELRASLEQQCAQSNQLCVVLKHEQTAKDNLRQELQIEASRCEALLAQERGHMSELQRSLEAERDRARELSEALQHERVLTERLSRRPQERPAHQALLQKLRAQEEHVRELEVALEAAQRRALEAEARVHLEEVEREQEVSAAPKTPPETLPGTRERPARGRGQVEQDTCEDARTGAELRPSRAETQPWSRWQRDKETLRELELQHQRDEHKIQQLQRTVQELQARVALPNAEPERLREQQRGLEKVRQQLLCAAGLLTSFINQTVDRTISDWTSSNEKAVASLLHTLETLKSELGTSSSCRKKTAAELQIQLVDVLLKDNESLSRALSTVTREKAELCKALSRLERTHRAPRTSQEGCARKRSDRSAWKQDKMVSPGSARHPDPALDAGACSAKMEKLYLRYLRAESFRKALIYQKKYLLLLIGGFQDSEQETLSMIAHLGVFPSKADKKAAESRPFTRFRTAVRVVIAVLRLRFLVKKWQQVDGRGALAPGQALRPGEGFLVPRRQQSPPVTRESPPTRDVSSSQARDPVPKASPRRREKSSPPSNPRSERSLTASQDPEHSLTEYIHHLEMIQQRLGGVLPDSTSKKSCCQKMKQ